MSEEEANPAAVSIERAEKRRQRMIHYEDIRRRQWLGETARMDEPVMVLESFDSGVRFDDDLARAFDMFANQQKPVTQELIVLMQILREVQREVQRTDVQAAGEADVQPVEVSDE